MKNGVENKKVRNIAIIAHVDHGKTTLVDFMLRQSGAIIGARVAPSSAKGGGASPSTAQERLLKTFRENQSEGTRIMDSMDLERERGITIASKNCSIHWKGTKINIIDTPGHADFGGEVERGLNMVNGAILLVDASEGPLPQTRFVLKKALESHLKIIVVINKIDRKDARPEGVLHEIYDLFIDLGAQDHQIDFPILYAIGRQGIVQKTLKETGKDLNLLFDTVLQEIPGPVHDPSEPFQMLVSNLSYSDYLGRLAVGRVFHGGVKTNENLVCIGRDNLPRPLKITKLQVYEGISLQEVEAVEAGDIIILSGIEEVEIGDTICTKAAPKALKRITVDEPTVFMQFMTNTSPFAGQEGATVQSRKILERLHKETLHNVALKLEEDPKDDGFIVKGRGEFQMAILIETMRREGFELCVGRPQIIFKEKGGIQTEPVEHLFIDCQEAFTGIVTQKLSMRKGRMINLVNHGTGRVRLEFSIPSRGLIGYRSEFLTDTKGSGIMNSYLEGYEDYRGEMLSRVTGSLVADRVGETVAYGLFHLEPRGTLFVEPNIKVYEGMIVGEHNRENDLDVNPCKTKKLSNMRAAGKDENIILTPALSMTLERAIEFIRDDEMVEVTPKSIRLRKSILQANQRHRASKQL